MNLDDEVAAVVVGDEVAAVVADAIVVGDEVAAVIADAIVVIDDEVSVAAPRTDNELLCDAAMGFGFDELDDAFSAVESADVDGLMLDLSNT